MCSSSSDEDAWRISECDEIDDNGLCECGNRRHSIERLALLPLTFHQTSGEERSRNNNELEKNKKESKNSPLHIFEEMTDPSTQQTQVQNQASINPNPAPNTPCSDLAITKTLVPQTYNLDECRRALIEFVIRDEMPFQVVEGHGFQNFVNCLEPRFPVPSRAIVARDCYKLFLEESKKLKAFLEKSCERVCLSINTWKSVQNLNYMCLTAHFIDEEWRLQKRILNFCVIENHRGDTIGKAIEKCLLEWRIQKVFSLTIDNASSSDTAVAYLKKQLKIWNGLVCDGDYLHVKCYAHILSLVVNDGLRDLHNSISTIRNVVKYVRSSPARLQRFKSFVEKEKIESESLVCLDIVTRWNSTYMMLEHAMKFREVFERMEDEDEDEGYNAHLREYVHQVSPSNTSDWSNVSVFVQYLKVFYNITLRFSGSLLVTSNACFHDIAHVQTMLKESAKHQDPLIRNIAKNMKGKFDKYRGNLDSLNPMLVMGVVLDPRYKLGYVNATLEDIYNFDLEMCETMKKRVKDTLYRLYEQYSVGVVTETPCILEMRGNVDNMDTRGLQMPNFVPIGPKDKWQLLKKSKVTSDKKKELERYLEAETLDDDDDDSFDILAWWKENTAKYKVLSLIARDVLAVPVSSVTSDSAFNTSGQVLDVFRSSLSPKMIEALVCTQNWLTPTKFKFYDPDFHQYEESNGIAFEVRGDSNVARDVMIIA